MFTTKVASAAALLVLVGGTAACGSSDSSSATDSAGPADADKASFCGTFQQMSDSTTPKEVAAAFQEVGTPSDIADDERAGYEVLVSKLSTMADDAKSSDLAAMEQSLSATDKKNVLAFGSYVTKECADALPSAPSS